MEIPTPSGGFKSFKDKDGHVHPDHRQRQSWTIKREIDPSFLLGVLAVLGGAFFYVARIESRQAVQGADIFYIQQEQAAQKAEKLVTNQQVREDLKAINDKLDRILEGRRR